jgi:AcrR family transcriptional regulator
MSLTAETSPTDTLPEIGSKREAGKEDRRKRILDAARALIRETGDTGLSMRAIAARANVSLATPYNLFGSKRAVVMAILENVREFHERFSGLKDLSAIERIFSALHITLSYHAADPDFYRAIWLSLLNPGGLAADDLRAELITPQSARFWRSLLEEAASEGAFDPDIDLKLLQLDLGGRFAAVMLTWVMGGCRADELEAAACFGYASSLCASASPEWRPRIRQRMLEFQAQILNARQR